MLGNRVSRYLSVVICLLLFAVISELVSATFLDFRYLMSIVRVFCASTLLLCLTFVYNFAIPSYNRNVQ